ncbi:hypothetical protein ACQ4PT_017221 [Festuca glaucescens]
MWNIKQVDVEIEVGGETFPANRWVLEAQSPVFKTELSLSWTAAGTTKLRVDDMATEVFRALLRFMYTDSPPETSQLEEARMAEKLLVAADRYKLDRLKQVCEEALCRRIGMNSVAATLAFAERHHCSALEAACMKFLSSPGNLEEFLAAGGVEQKWVDAEEWPEALKNSLGRLWSMYHEASDKRIEERLENAKLVQELVEDRDKFKKNYYSLMDDVAKFMKDQEKRVMEANLKKMNDEKEAIFDLDMPALEAEVALLVVVVLQVALLLVVVLQVALVLLVLLLVALLYL